MTIPAADPSKRIPELAMLLLGAFAHVQTFIDQFVKAHVRMQMPVVGPRTNELAIGRIRDKDRPRLFCLIAGELGSEADLGVFTGSYMDVKDLRDACAHAPLITETSSRDEGLINAPYTRLDPDEVYKGDRPVTRSEFDDSIHKCRWMEAQVLYVLVTDLLRWPELPSEEPTRSHFATAMMPNMRGVPVMKPSRRPADWHGHPWE